MTNRKNLIVVVSIIVTLLVVGVFVLVKNDGLSYYQKLKKDTTDYKILPTANKSRVKSGQELFANAEFVGSETCKSCHQQQYNDWKNTWHSKMERPLKPDEVVGDFNNVVLQMKDIEIAKDPSAQKKEFVKVNATVIAQRQGDKFYFTLVDENNSSNNQKYEIGYLIGGAWEQLYETKVGDNIYPAPIRWVVQDNAWRSKGFNTADWFKLENGKAVPRRPDELFNDVSTEAKCAGCHDTGYKAKTDPNSKKIIGSSKEMSISCESCHGPGSLHVANGGDRSKIINPLKDLDTVQQNQVCGQCHSRVNSKDNKTLAFPVGFLPGDKSLSDKVAFWSYSFGGVKPEKLWWANNYAKSNRQQYQDMQTGPHAQTNVSCITCHTGHGSTIKGLGMLRVEKKDTCSSCHTQQGQTGRPNLEMYKGSVMEKAGVTCADCHMAHIANRADKTKVRDNHWDVSSHTFVAVSPETKADWGVRSACEQCHVDKGKANPKEAEVNRYIDNKNKFRDQQIALQKDLTSVEREINKKNASADVIKLATEARGDLDFVVQDGSFGFHYPGKTQDLLNEAKTKIDKAKSKLGI